MDSTQSTTQLNTQSSNPVQTVTVAEPAKPATILDYNIWDVLGLDITDADKSEMNEDFIESAWMELIDNRLKELLGQAEYDKLYQSLKAQNLNISEFIQSIKDECEFKTINIDTELDTCLIKVLKEFVEDQINFLEKRINGIKDTTERDVKLSLIKSLWDLFSTNQWDKMGEIFRKVDGYGLPESLVLHL